MNIMDLLNSKENNSAIAQIARQFGISEAEARKAMGALSPSVARGLQQRTREEIGMNDLIDALGVGKHERYIEEPELLGRESATKDGNAILGHIFGSKEVSRNVARDAGEKTSMGSSLMKRMLPVIASMVMASLSKKVFGGSAKPQREESGGLLTSLLDSDGDGSIIDDVLGMAFKSFLR